MITTASEVAKFILGHSQSRGVPINNLKLQKLLYYSQAHYLVSYDTPLFGDRIEAWVHGPVVPPVYGEYKSFRWSPILIEGSAKLSEKHSGLVSSVLAAYGDFSAWELERLSHSEDPWKQARAGIAPDQSSNAVITLESMKAYYR
jgi:uncharacterized phage-associated protein